ncbi:sugar dehydrogenase complex small subunit [Pseudomonas sp. FME51]|uniref:sugar dehydrogenase complex small subunit n=1 Tax=Pseudomonas sp. FME51 TaxID=2742609 RepID=UPI001866217C|nr:sugar dehydrogenase complex small subunit [Pseudomonas sp. FME51]
MTSVSQDREGRAARTSVEAPLVSRRVILGGLLTAYTASLIPWAVAQSAPDADRGNFLALSALIAGRQSLDNDLAMRYYDALVAADPDFPSAVTALLTLINQQQIDPLQLQAILDENHPELAGVPRKIATAWFLGIVDAGDRVKVLAYEHALNADAVSDVLKPPSYCFGGYGSWANKPS